MTTKSTIPPKKGQIQLDVESMKRYATIVKAGGRATPAEMSHMYSIVAEKKDAFRNLLGVYYEPPIDCSLGDKHHLMNIYIGLKGSHWNKKFGWVGQLKTTSQPECGPMEAEASLLEGLKTRRMMSTEADAKVCVTELNMGGFGCIGSLPSGVCELKTLKAIRLNWNLLKGKVPSAFSQLEFLETIDLSGNMVTGELDSDTFKGLGFLRKIDLSFNQISGTIPDCFHDNPSLEEVNMSGNFFKQSIPFSLGRLASLKVLKLYSNKLSGDLPYVFDGCPLLEEVNLSGNQFTGSIDVFRQCMKLKKLILNNNQLHHPLPRSISNLTELNVLYLQNNLICGRLPAAICRLTKLDLFSAANNQIKGLLPKQIGNLDRVRVFKLSGNQINGPVPLSIARMINLKDFHIFAPYPADDSAPTRAFLEHHFHRIYRFGTKNGIDHVHWVNDDVYGPGGHGGGFERACADIKKAERLAVGVGFPDNFENEDNDDEDAEESWAEEMLGKGRENVVAAKTLTLNGQEILADSNPSLAVLPTITHLEYGSGIPNRPHGSAGVGCGIGKVEENSVFSR